MREKRKKLGLRQLDLARMAGVSRPTVIRIEEGRMPRYDVMIRIAEILKMPLERVAI